MEDLLKFYQYELASFRAYSREFATRYPKTAGALLFGGETSEDPHIERLVQSFALLTSRVKMQLEDEYPKFTEALLESLYPHYLRPLPSYSIVQITSRSGAERSASPTGVPRGTMLHSEPVNGVVCRFRTVYDVSIGAVQISAAAFVPALASAGSGPLPPGAASAITLEIAACDPSIDLREPPFELLRVYVAGEPSLRASIVDAIFMRGCGVSIQPKGSGSWVWLDQTPMRLAGLEDDEAMFPFSPRSNAAFRLLTEYFAYSEKFAFFDIDLATVARHLPPQSSGFTLRVALAGLQGNSYAEQALASLTADNFQLGCTPVINLFDKRGVPTQLTYTSADHPLLADSAHPAAYEIYSVNSVDLVRETPGDPSVTVFYPMYGDPDLDEFDARRAHYWLMRHDEVLADLSPGHEKRISLVDQSFSPSDQLGAILRTEMTCTNRDLPLALGYGHAAGDLTSDAIPAALTVRMVRKPSRTMRFDRQGHDHWQLISHLTANYSSLTNAGLANLRRTLGLYDMEGTAAGKRQIDGVVALQHGAVRAWMPTQPVSSLMPGIGIRMTIDEEAFVGSSIYIFIHVIDRYFALNSQLNCFTQLEVISKQTGKELFKCKPRVVEPLRA